MSSDTTDATGSLSDPYIERLRQKYLVKCEIASSCMSELAPENGTSDTVSIPPNSSLTESERRHYKHAMKELHRGLEIGRTSLISSLAEYNDAMQSSTEQGENKTCSVKEAILASGSDTDKPSAFRTVNTTLTKSTTLPTLPSSGYVDNSESDDVDGQPSVTLTADTFSVNSRVCENSDSTFPPLMKQLKIADIKAIYAELMSIHKKLQGEKLKIAERELIEQEVKENFDLQNAELVMREAELLQRERELLEREEALAVYEQNMRKTHEIAARLEGVELEVQERLDLMKQQHCLELEHATNSLQEKCRDFKRLKASFDTVKNQNEELRKKVEGLASENERLQAQNIKVKKRFDNLQQRQDFKASKSNVGSHLLNRAGKENVDLQSSGKTIKQMDKSQRHWGSALEALSILLDWISEVHLKNCRNTMPSMVASKDPMLSKEFLTDKCLKILPMLVDIIKLLLSQTAQPKQLLPYLSFAYWSLCHLEETQHTMLSSTARRLGEELYKPTAPQGISSKSTSVALILSSGIGSMENSRDIDMNESKSFKSSCIRSMCPKIRLLSCVIMLKALHQVDTLAQAFVQLKKDLKEELNREFFLDLKATLVVLPFMTYKANKALMSHAVDVLLQMTLESPLLPVFLDQCSSEDWFRAFSSALRPPNTSSKSAVISITTLEKLSILLQKLSKIKSNRRFFDAFSMGRNLQEWYRQCDPQNTFLSLNLRSILFNLNLKQDGNLGSVNPSDIP